MIRDEFHPVIINGSYIDEGVRAFAPLARAVGGKDLERQLTSGANIFDYVEDNSPQAKGYEETVRLLLRDIRNSVVGTELFKSLPRDKPVWIIPYDSLVRKNYDPRNALTSFVDVNDLSKGMRIQYSPEQWSVVYTPYSAADEVLLHELVHASRHANFGHNQKNDQVPDNDGDAEEFYAFQMVNVYRSGLGLEKLFHENKRSPRTGTHAEVERTLSMNVKALQMVEYFRLVDPLCKLIMRLKTRYNPFRDWDRLMQMHQKWVKAGRPRPH